MGRVELENLAKSGLLHEEPFARQEYANLIDSGRVRLKDSRRAELSIESRFDLAYNAAHSLALAALRRTGYRSVNRITVFSALVHTAQLPAATCRLFVTAHGLRNAAEYEGEIELDERFTAEFINAVGALSDSMPPSD